MARRTHAPFLNVESNSSLYRMHMDTVFTAPFSGMGYFIGSYDDFADMNLTSLSGDTIADSERIISSGYTGYVPYRFTSLLQLVERDPNHLSRIKSNVWTCV